VLDRLVDFFLDCLQAFRFWDVVDQWERAVVLRLGRYHREVGPGLVWCLPFYVDRVLAITAVTDVEKLDPQTLTTADGRAVTLRPVVTFTVVDVRRALLEVTTVRRSLEDACAGEVGRLVSKTNAEDLTEARFWGVLTRACQARAREWGISISRVQLSDVAVSRNLRIWTDSKTPE
jgi:regulator of protease activity HflC (stomatin/prohibitin superfamily)